MAITHNFKHWGWFKIFPSLCRTCEFMDKKTTVFWCIFPYKTAPLHTIVSFRNLLSNIARRLAWMSRADSTSGCCTHLTSGLCTRAILAGLADCRSLRTSWTRKSSLNRSFSSYNTHTHHLTVSSQLGLQFANILNLRVRLGDLCDIVSRRHVMFCSRY